MTWAIAFGGLLLTAVVGLLLFQQIVMQLSRAVGA